MISGLLFERGADLQCRFFDKAQIDLIAGKRCSHGDDREVGVEHGFAQVRGRAEPVIEIPAQKVFESGLMNRRLAAVDAIDFGLVHVHANDSVPFFGEANTRDQPDITATDDRYLHHASSASWLSRYHTSVRRSPSSIEISGLNPSSDLALAIEGQRRRGLSVR